MDKIKNLNSEYLFLHNSLTKKKLQNSLEFESFSKSKLRYLKLQTEIDNTDSIFNFIEFPSRY